jgi:hypothetical protein
MEYVELFKALVTQKSRRSLLLAKGDRRSAGLEIGFESGRPERLPRAFKTAKLLGRSPDLKNYRCAYRRSRSLITVARPHGILTRFPILPIPWGTQLLSITKNNL